MIPVKLFECSEYLKISRERVRKNDRPLLGESASPFIDEGDGLISKRGRVCAHVLLSLVAHAVRYKTVIGAHNSVYVRRVWQALPCSPSMANVGAYNTIR